MKDLIKQIKELGIVEYLHSIVIDEEADIVMTIFLSFALGNCSEADIDDLEQGIIEELGEFYE